MFKPKIQMAQIFSFTTLHRQNYSNILRYAWVCPSINYLTDDVHNVNNSCHKAMALLEGVLQLFAELCKSAEQKAYINVCYTLDIVFITIHNFNADFCIARHHQGEPGSVLLTCSL